MGQHMRRIGMKRTLTSNGFVTYSVGYQAERCDGCQLRGSCFKARGNRIIEVNHQLRHYKQKARELLTQLKTVSQGTNGVPIAPDGSRGMSQGKRLHIMGR